LLSLLNVALLPSLLFGKLLSALFVVLTNLADHIRPLPCVLDLPEHLRLLALEHGDAVVEQGSVILCQLFLSVKLQNALMARLDSLEAKRRLGFDRLDVLCRTLDVCS